MMVYSDKSAAEAIVEGLRDVQDAYDKMDHYRHGHVPPHIEDDLQRALLLIGEGVRWASELAEPRPS